jgi:serine/threonine-protein kinase
MVPEPISPTPEDGASPQGFPSVADPLISSLLHGKYRLIRKIGAGGFGTVYEAQDERGAGNRVAIKVLRKELSSDARLVKAFRAEARRMTRLSHPNIVDWKNFDAAEDGTCYFVMELVEGEELDRALQRKRPMSPTRAAKILLQVLDALRAAHHLAEGGSVLHLDLKPRNVFLLPPRTGRDESVKVIDFGIGQHIGEEAEEGAAVSAGGSHLETSAVPDFNPSTLRFSEAIANDPPGLKRCQGCTPEYVSPEQAAHVLGLADVVQLDGRSDVYSLGVMAYQMLTGDLPFARPVMRTDYLRLHLSGQPRKISATRAKVPRPLARFVDRCLRKNRDDRFPDTRAAYAALERVVRPPIAFRVVAATVVLAGAAFAFGGYLMKGGARPEVLAAAGVELGSQTPLYLGPQERSASLKLRAPGLLDGSSRIALVRAADGAEVPGSRLSLAAPDELRLEFGEDPSPGRLEQSVRVDGHGARFALFDLVWLGPSAWDLPGASVDDVALAVAGAPRALDPAGLSLEVAISGEGRDDVARVVARPEGGDAVDLVPAGALGDRRRFRADLSLFQLRPGDTRLSIHAEDRAGGAHDLEVPIEVVEGILTADAELCAPEADGSCSPFNQNNGRYLLAPTSKGILRATSSRPAKLDWRVRAEGESSEPAWNHGEPALKHEVPFDLATVGAVDASSGWIELRLDEGDRVIRARTSQGGLASRTLPFLVSAEKAEFAAFLAIEGKPATPLAEDRTAWVASRKLALVVERRGRAGMRVRLGDGRMQDLRSDDAELRFPLEFTGEGVQSVEVEATRYDTAGQSLADRPDTKRSFRIGVDTIPPAIAMPAVLENADFHALDAMPEDLSLGPIAGGDTAPVRVDWKLVRDSGGSERSGVAAEGDLRIPLRGLWNGQSALSDGTWRLELDAADAAGNAAKPVEARFRVALQGPEVRFEAPRIGRWQSEAQGWSVQLRVSDPNGVAAATCAILAEDGSRIPVTLVPTAGTPEDREMRGFVSFPYEWSERAVRLEVEARDEAGQPRTATLEGITLSPIEPPHPPVVRAVDGRGPVLRRVLGNAGAQYLFGGRGDDVERRAFPTSGAARSWSIPYAAGEIGDFYLDEREVTRGEFLAFVRDPHGYGDASHWPHGSEAPTEARAKEALALLSGDADLPVADVTWEEASAFAHWAGRRLPSWVEFEYAIRGGPSAYRPFASFHGGPAESGTVNAKGQGPGRPWSSGQSGDRTDTGIRDLSGNVSEWTATPLFLPGDPEVDDRAAYFRGKRLEMLAPRDRLSGRAEECKSYWTAGGSFRDEKYFFEAAAAHERGFRAGYVGFRCALSIEDVRAGLARGGLEEVR